MKKLKLNLHPSMYQVNTWISVLTISLSSLLVINIFRYANISLVVFLHAIILFILLNIMSALLDLASKYYRNLKILSIIYSIVLLVISIFGNYYLLRIQGSVDSAIIDTEKTQTEEIVTNFVVYDNSSIESIEDLVGKKFGYIDNELIQEGNLLAKAELESKEISVNFVGYANYTDLLLGLFNKEIDVAPMPEDYYAMYISNEGFEEYLEKTTVIHTFSEKVEFEGVEGSTKDLTEDPFTILVIGNADGLSDTLILTTFNPKTMTATMTSIARDSYVPIACYTNQESDKITHARAVSRQCTIDTVSDLLDVEIDYFVEVNFQAVVDIVDALDGLYLYSPVEFVGQDASSIRGTFTVWVGEGWQTMDGLQALAFSRERHAMPNGDLDRQIHQQEVISAIVAKLLDTKDITKLINVIDAAGENIKTNLPLSQMTDLAQYLIMTMNQSTVNSSYLLQIKSSRLSGYFSWAYNEQLELPLIIMKPYNAAIEDAKKLINDNLEVNYTLNNQKYFTFSISSPYATPIFIKDYYNEQEIHDKLPDFMPSMTSATKVWNLQMVEDWAASRSWIDVTIKEIWEGDAGYVSSYANNQVVSQSTKYGVLTNKISNLTIGIIKQDLDCSIVENQTDSQCKYIVPNFVGMKVADIDVWAQKNNFPVNIVVIPETDPSYDRTKVGLISSQMEKAYTKLSKLTVEELTVYTMDYPSVSLPVSLILSTPYTMTTLDEWWKLNMYTKQATYVYDPQVSNYPRDTIIGVKLNNQVLTSDTVVRTDIKTLTFILSSGTNATPVASNAVHQVTIANGTYSSNLTASDVNPGQTLVYSIVTQPSTGTLSLIGSTFTYTPALNAVAGNVTFTFKANDGFIDSNIATITLSLN